MTNRTHQFDDKHWLSFGKDVCVCAHVSASFCFFLFLRVSFHKHCMLPHEQPHSHQAAQQNCHTATAIVQLNLASYATFLTRLFCAQISVNSQFIVTSTIERKMPILECLRVWDQQKLLLDLLHVSPFSRSDRHGSNF